MPRKILIAAALMMLVTAPSPVHAQLTRETVTLYSNQLRETFPDKIDVFLAGPSFDYSKPSLSDVKMLGCSQVAGVLYYVVRMGNGSETLFPQSQVVAIHNRK